MKLVLGLLLVAALTSFSGPAASGCANGDARSGGEILDDSVITTKVKSALLADAEVDSREIEVSTCRRAVHLFGSVGTQWQIDKAGAVTAAVGGVGQVTNHLTRELQ